MNNSESFLLLLKNLLKCTYEVLLPSQRIALKNTYTFYYSQLSFMKCVVSITIGNTAADSFLSHMHKSMVLLLRVQVAIMCYPKEGSVRP